MLGGFLLEGRRPSLTRLALGVGGAGEGTQVDTPPRCEEPKGTHPVDTVPRDCGIPPASAVPRGSQARPPPGESGETEAGRAGAGAAPAREEGGQPPGAGAAAHPAGAPPGLGEGGRGAAALTAP